MGFGCLKRRERRAIEMKIVEIHEETPGEDDDEVELNQSQSPSNNKEKSKAMSSMAKFLYSIGKKNLISSSKSKSNKKTILNEEIISYRSLAQTEYNTVVDNDKDPNVVRTIWSILLFRNSFFRYCSCHFGNNINLN